MIEYTDIIEEAATQGNPIDGDYIGNIIFEAWNGGYADELVYSSSNTVRAAVANTGLALDILINDRSWKVRRAVAKQRYGLDKLIYDENILVRNIAREMWVCD